MATNASRTRRLTCDRPLQCCSRIGRTRRLLHCCTRFSARRLPSPHAEHAKKMMQERGGLTERGTLISADERQYSQSAKISENKCSLLKLVSVATTAGRPSGPTALTLAVPLFSVSLSQLERGHLGHLLPLGTRDARIPLFDYQELF